MYIYLHGLKIGTTLGGSAKERKNIEQVDMKETNMPAQAVLTSIYRTIEQRRRMRLCAYSQSIQSLCIHKVWMNLKTHAKFRHQAVGYVNIGIY